MRAECLLGFEVGMRLEGYCWKERQILLVQKRDYRSMAGFSGYRIVRRGWKWMIGPKWRMREK